MLLLTTMTVCVTIRASALTLCLNGHAPVYLSNNLCWSASDQHVLC